MERVANSTPIVDLESRLNSFRVNRESRLDFPTPLSPIKTTVGGDEWIKRAVVLGWDQLPLKRN